MSEGGKRGRKWNLPLTYEPKIPGVLDGTIRQTVRPGRKFSPDDQVAFHGWEGKPYRSKWSFRTPYHQLQRVFPVTIYPNGMEILGNYREWHELDAIAIADGINPPTGAALGDLFNAMYKIPQEGIEGQIIRW